MTILLGQISEVESKFGDGFDDGGTGLVFLVVAGLCQIFVLLSDLQLLCCYGSSPASSAAFVFPLARLQGDFD